MFRFLANCWKNSNILFEVEMLNAHFVLILATPVDKSCIAFGHKVLANIFALTASKSKPFFKIFFLL